MRADCHYLLVGLQQVIDQAAAQEPLGRVEIDIREEAGACICGEEPALMDSIEGQRGEARLKPPFPPSKVLQGKPMIINNVETLI